VLALGSFTAVDLPALVAVMVAVEHHRLGEALVLFAGVRSRSVRTDDER
jgi:hypothetical protein